MRRPRSQFTSWPSRAQANLSKLTEGTQSRCDQRVISSDENALGDPKPAQDSNSSRTFSKSLYSLSSDGNLVYVHRGDYRPLLTARRQRTYISREHVSAAVSWNAGDGKHNDLFSAHLEPAPLELIASDPPGSCSPSPLDHEMGGRFALVTIGRRGLTYAE